VKILLDECLPLDLRHSFSNHDTHTVQWAGLKGKGNGELLQAAEVAGYDVLLTVDQGMRSTRFNPARPSRFHEDLDSLTPPAVR